jgi:hypothetical protein
MQICENLDVREVPQRDSTYTNVSEWDYRTKQTRTVDQAKLEAVTWINNEYERDWKNILTLTSTTSKTPSSGSASSTSPISSASIIPDCPSSIPCPKVCEDVLCGDVSSLLASVTAVITGGSGLLAGLIFSDEGSVVRGIDAKGAADTDGRLDGSVDVVGAM